MILIIFGGALRGSVSLFMSQSRRVASICSRLHVHDQQTGRVVEMLPVPQVCPHCHGSGQPPFTTVRAWERHMQSALRKMNVEVGGHSHVSETRMVPGRNTALMVSGA